jgi:ABC-type sulfate transport system substrate-binding protein
MTKVMIRQEMQDMMIEMCVIMSFSVQQPQAVFNITQDQRECRQLLTHYYNYMYSLNPYQRQCECTTLIKKIAKMAIPPP